MAKPRSPVPRIDHPSDGCDTLSNFGLPITVISEGSANGIHVGQNENDSEHAEAEAAGADGRYQTCPALSPGTPFLAPFARSGAC